MSQTSPSVPKASTAGGALDGVVSDAHQLLPHHTEGPLILTQIENAISANGLSWPTADFRILPATSDIPATLNIRFTLKGPYPKLRGTIATLLAMQPALAIHDLTMNRTASNEADVEAKLGLTVFLEEEPVGATAAKGGS